MSAPSVSVVIPAYNSAPWIAETVESVLAQTSPADEVIVVDDGSTDGTVDALAPYGSRITLISQPNGGAAAALNRGFAEAAGGYVARIGSDDLWDPRKLEWQREALRAHPEADISVGHARHIGLYELEYKRPPGEGVLDPDVLRPALYVRCLFVAPSALIRRELHERLGAFREGQINEDYEFWLRALRAGAVFHYEPRLICHHRRHGGNLSSQLQPTREADLEIHREYARDVPPELAARVLAADLRQIAR